MVETNGDLAGSGGGVLGTLGKGGLLELGIGGSVEDRGIVKWLCVCGGDGSFLVASPTEPSGGFGKGGLEFGVEGSSLILFRLNVVVRFERKSAHSMREK